MTIMNPARTMLIGTALATSLLAVGCSSSTPAASHTPTAPRSSSSTSAAPSKTAAASSKTTAAATTITIKNFGYTVSGTAPSGSKVKITNNDGEAHTVTADSGKAFDVTIPPGKTASLTAPATAGSYKFHCSFHSNMHGTLTVSK